MNTSKMERLMENVACPLGCGNTDEIVLTGRDRIHDLPGKFTIVKCKACRLMRTNPRPTPETIGFYYPDDYAPYIGTRVQNEAPKSAGWAKKLLRPAVRHLFDFKTTALPTMAPGRMLEIGCASGAFLHEMSGLGWQVQGIEFSPKAAQAAIQLGYKVHSGPLETAPPPDEPFDLIVGWMVLEHLHDPIGCLRRLRDWAKPDTLLALSIPNAGSLEFRLFKDKWYALHLPNHLHHFTPHTLELVLNSSGWKLEKVHHQRVLNNLIASTGYVFRDNGFPRLAQFISDLSARIGRLVYVMYPMAWLFSLFGQTGRMTIWARPSNNSRTQ